MRTKLWSAAVMGLILAGGCDDGSSEGNLGVAMFSVSPSSVPPGGSALVAWRVTAADRVRLEACTGFDPAAPGCASGAVREVPIPNPTAASGSVLTTVSLPTRFGVTALTDDGRTASSEWIAVAIDAPPPGGPQVIDFRASPRVIFPGDTAVTVTTQVRNAGGEQLLVCDATGSPDFPSDWDTIKTYEPDGAGMVQQVWELTRTEIPTQSRLYGLKTAGGLVLGYAQLVVRSGTESVPYILEFSMDPVVVDEGDDVTITWNVMDATTIGISPTVAGFTGASSAGTYVFAPAFLGTGATVTSETIYTMTASNGEYSDYARVMISVNARPVVDSFTAFPTTVASGGAVTLAWETSRASEVVITAEPPDAGLPATFALDDTTGITVHPTATTTYTLTATGATATPTTATATATVGSGASVDSFAAAPAVVAVGGTAVTLTWTTTNADTVAIAAVPADATLPATFTLDGTATAHPAAGGTTTYTITASGPVGPDAIANDTVLAIAPGDLVITEIMFDPAGIADNMGEWFEVYNTTTHAIPLGGFSLRDGTATHAVAGTPSLPAGDWFVFGINSTIATNGGAAVDYQYSTLAWANTGTLAPTVAFDGVTIDTTSLTIPGAWAQGDAIVLNPSFTTAAGNDVAANWCIARAADAFGSDGNHGTPGAVNACP